MIIHRPDINTKSGEVCISAGIEFQAFVRDVPDKLWFKFPATYSKFIADYADGFVVSLLLLAMTLGEDIEVRGELSERLVYGMQEYQRIFNLWLPGTLKIVNIKTNGLIEEGYNETKCGVGCAFSGGIDSFYTLWLHIPQNERLPSYQLTHALFVHGFDVPLENISTYLACKQAYSELMEKMGLELLTASTNASQFLNVIKNYNRNIGWGHTHGQVLIGVALILGRLFSRFYIPASFTYRQSDLFPWGSHPLLDSLLSTETLQVIHDGASIGRVEKIITLAQWPLTYPLLRVCSARPDGLKNCCICKKCVRTMIVLEICGALSKYTTFPLQLKRKNIRSYSFWTEYSAPFIRENIRYAVAMGRKDIAFDLYFSIALSKSVLYLTCILSYIIPIKYIEWVKTKLKDFFKNTTSK